ncbi:MAG: nitrogenase stabilizing/protective protein NifW [Pseudomonadota bacterium]
MTTRYDACPLEHIASLSSAEEIFSYLLMPYEPEVMNVARLHIMKRFGAYLGKEDFAGKDESETFLAARTVLKRAYLDFIESSPIAEKVFKVHQDEAAKQKARFVGLDQLTLAAE